MARVTIPSYDLSRPEKLKLALVAGVARRLLVAGDLALGLVARDPDSAPDALVVTRVGASAGEAGALTEELPWELGAPEVVEAVLALAVQVGAEGWEGHPVGALFTLGDAGRVMERSRQLGLNPFQGYSERERNLVDPAVREAVLPFATLDGAIVCRDDGVVVAAGRYLEIGDAWVQVPLGLGARHMAAAGISVETAATAFAISQTTGVVRIFRGGRQLLQLTPSRRRI
jgi:DNA integrity scanning protein DisA with diadenylate cyclase activity